MSCPDWETQLSPWLDGELSPQEAGRLKQHLRDCDACTEQLERLKRASRAFRSLGPEAPSTGFEARLWQRLDEEGLPKSYPVGASRRFWFPLAGLVAASLVLILARPTTELPLPPPMPEAHPPWVALTTTQVGTSAALDLAETPCLSAADCGSPRSFRELSADGDLTFIAGWCEGRLIASPECEGVEVM
ncbi:MAG: zf-HC2 domain-containing protein [Deltaproteobacteria bacterium]|nr:zf-HC2 domain-containing protein [Deltaproteobacteria bacterium]